MPYGPGVAPSIFQNGAVPPWNNLVRGIPPRLQYDAGNRNDNQLIAYRPHPLYRPYLFRYFLPNVGYWYFF